MRDVFMSAPANRLSIPSSHAFQSLLCQQSPASDRRSGHGDYLQNAAPNGQAQLPCFPHDTPHACFTDAPALIFRQEEELVHFHTVFCRDRGHHTNVLTALMDNPKVLRLEPLSMKPPLLILIPAVDLFDIFSAGRLLDYINEFAVFRGRLSQCNIFHIT